MKLFPGDVVKYKSPLLPQHPCFIVAVKPDSDDVLMLPVGQAQGAAQIRAQSTELTFISHSTARMAQAIFHLKGTLIGTTDEQTLDFINMLIEILDPDGSLSKVADEEMQKAAADHEQAASEAETGKKSKLVAVGVD